MNTHISKIQFCESFRLPDYHIVFWGRQGKGIMENVPGWGNWGLKKLRDTKFQAWKLEALGHICPACYTSQNDFNTGTYTSLPLPAHLPEISIFNSNSWARYSFTGSLEVIYHPITIRLLGKGSGSLQLELNLGWCLWGSRPPESAGRGGYRMSTNSGKLTLLPVGRGKNSCE